jgi:hypothetical protein
MSFKIRRRMYWVVPVALLAAIAFVPGCGDDDDDELCSDAEVLTSEALCEAFAEDNFCNNFDFTPPDNCVVTGCDCVIIDDDVFDD